jgi:hypothetical protein
MTEKTFKVRNCHNGWTWCHISVIPATHEEGRRIDFEASLGKVRETLP